MLDCICTKRMLENANEGTCLWCGHGDAHSIHTITEARLARLPRDLGAHQREGRRFPDRTFENIQRLPLAA